MIRVLIADDHAIVRHGLKQILAEERDIEVVDTGDADDVLRIVRSLPCDIVVLDLDFKGRSGFEVLKDVKQEFPTLPILILSVHSEDQFAVRTLQSGAAGYLTKASAPDDLIKAIRKISRGGTYISESIAEKLLLNLNKDTGRRAHESLSRRERQVLTLLASGKTITEIAQNMSLGVPTVSTYRARILEKMHLRTTAELIRYAIQNKLVG
jgi:two-component system invasion response regulator UvrY